MRIQYITKQAIEHNGEQIDQAANDAAMDIVALWKQSVFQPALYPKQICGRKRLSTTWWHKLSE